MSPRYLDAKRVRSLQVRALQNGGSVRPFADGSSSRTVDWNVAGNCSNPVSVLLHGRRELKNERFNSVVCSDASTRPSFLEVEAACRRCDNCLARRARMWQLRAMHEYRVAPRTWLATFTLSPTAAMLLLSRARVNAAKRGTDIDLTPGDGQYLAHEHEGFREFQLWAKRLRKVTSVKFRYLLVSEVHKSGVPHWHALLHEVDNPLRYSDLKDSWPHGFDSYKLVSDARAAGYVTKYLQKAVAARVRASIRYGGPVVPTLPPSAEA